METTSIQKRFILIGAVSGIIAAIFYPLLFYIDFDLRVQLVLNLAFGFAIGFTSYGLFRFIRINRDSVCLQIGALTGILAAFTYVMRSGIFAAMTAPLEGILVQGDQSFVYGLTNRFLTGIVFVWDLLIGASIFAFSVTFFLQPRPGKIISLAGIIFASVIIIYSLATFPGTIGIISFTGMGAALPAWHLVVSLLMLFSLKWIKVKNPSPL